MPVGTISIPQNGKKYIACKSAKNRNGIHWSPICMNLDCTTHVQTPGDMCACISGKSRRVFPKTAEIGDIFRDNNDVLWVPFWYNRLLRWRPKCSTPDCVTMVIKEGSACRWCKCGMKRIIHPKNPYIGMTFIDEDTGVTYRYDPGEQWHALCAVCDNISVFLGYCRGHAHENGIGVFEKNATGVWLMNLISPGGYEVGVYGGFSKLSNPKHAAQQQVTRDGCTTRHLTRQGFKPDIENAFVLHVGSSENRFQRKFYARDKLGAICTFHRPQKQNVLSPQEMDEIDVAIENNLQNIPDITLFGMNKMDFWQNRPKFQGHYRKRRITLTEEEYQKVVKEVEDKLRESAWETMMEQDKDADE
ncbi:uncharacterized protein LOC118434969 [Folsomia candida]|uniref:uncharacterized protein LOC118434969 n=1 Tax=Folsomia candida TaxID=158441 RepID=UPI001604DFE4|nr:uncharacterized protein LOC118434969 [Folsomia candida]